MFGMAVFAVNTPALLSAGGAADGRVVILVEVGTVQRQPFGRSLDDLELGMVIAFAFQGTACSSGISGNIRRYDGDVLVVPVRQLAGLQRGVMQPCVGFAVGGALVAALVCCQLHQALGFGDIAAN